jgi:hypothetical protein
MLSWESGSAETDCAAALAASTTVQMSVASLIFIQAVVFKFLRFTNQRLPIKTTCAVWRLPHISFRGYPKKLRDLGFAVYARLMFVTQLPSLPILDGLGRSEMKSSIRKILPDFDSPDSAPYGPFA